MTRRRLFAGVDKLDEAEAEAALAKQRLSDTLGEIKHRLTPSRLLEDAIGEVRTRSTNLAGSARDLVRDRPAAVAAGIAGVVLIAARKPLCRLMRRLFSRR